jgi:DNA-binding transcriptional regulator LsrR (DeoR family)
MDPRADTRPTDLVSSDSLLGYRAAVLHYFEHKSNLAIAKELGVSRFRVARLLDQAVESGTVKISISAPFGEDVELGQRLRDRFSLVHALVTPTNSESDPLAIKRSAATLAAAFLQQTLIEGMVVGVSWGSTLDAVANAATALKTDYPRCDLVQLFGGVPTLKGSLHASELLRRFADLLRGSTYALQAPLIVPSLETADGLRGEESIARTLAMVSNVDVAVLGVGAWEPVASGLVEVLPAAEVKKAQEAGVFADICGLLMDRDGNFVAHDLTDRMITATADAMLQIPLRLAIATGIDKAEAVHAAIKAGVINSLVTDSVTATILLDS